MENEPQKPTKGRHLILIVCTITLSSGSVTHHSTSAAAKNLKSSGTISTEDSTTRTKGEKGLQAVYMTAALLEDDEDDSGDESK
jgi:hypothetical protein